MTPNTISVAETDTQVNRQVWIVGESPATPEDEDELWWWYSLDDGDDEEEPAIEDDYTWIARGC